MLNKIKITLSKKKSYIRIKSPWSIGEDSLVDGF